MNRRIVLSAAALAAPAMTVSAQPAADIEAVQREVWDTEVAFARTMAQRDLAAFERFLSPHTVWWSGQQGTNGCGTELLILFTTQNLCQHLVICQEDLLTGLWRNPGIDK